MPRKARELVDGGIYHVYNRGNNRMDLFCDEKDNHFFLKRLLVSKRELNIQIFHYCLMTNHYHLLLKIQKADNLTQLMYYVQLKYAKYYKKKYGYLGHVFQQRFRSPRIPKDSYYLQCGRYIERNPIKAGVVAQAEQYAYSSAQFYIQGKRDDLVTRNMYYDGMGRNEKEKQERYREFVRLDEPYYDFVDKSLQVA